MEASSTLQPDSAGAHSPHFHRRVLVSPHPSQFQDLAGRFGLVLKSLGFSDVSLSCGIPVSPHFRPH